MSALDLSFFDRNLYILFPKTPLRPAGSQDVKHGIVLTGLKSSEWHEFIAAVEAEFTGDYDPYEEKLCVYFHKGPRLDSYIWNRVWTMTDGGRPLELAKLDVAVVPISHRTLSSSISSMSGVSDFLSNLTDGVPPSQVRTHLEEEDCCVLDSIRTHELNPQDSVSQISSAERTPSITSEDVSLISRAEKSVLKSKAKRLDALTRELRAIQIGSKAGLSVETLRDLLGVEFKATRIPINLPPPAAQKLEGQDPAGLSLVSFATSAAIPILVTLTVVAISVKGCSPNSVFPPLRYLHNLITASNGTPTSMPVTATIMYRAAPKLHGLDPHNLTVLIPLFAVGSAVVGWNVLCRELEIEGFWGQTGLVGLVLSVIEKGADVDWSGLVN